MILAEERTVTKLGKCLDSLPYADTLKKEIIFKKVIWLHFMLLQDSVEGIEEGQKHAIPPDLCTPSALLWEEGSSRPFICSLEGKSQVLEASSICQ